MEENHEGLPGRPADWVDQLQEDIFPDNERITAKKVWNKYTNIKKAWKEAKTIQEQSGFGLMAMLWLIPQSNLRAIYIANAIAKTSLIRAIYKSPKALSMHAEINQKASVGVSEISSNWMPAF